MSYSLPLLILILNPLVSFGQIMFYSPPTSEEGVAEILQGDQTRLPGIPTCGGGISEAIFHSINTSLPIDSGYVLSTGTISDISDTVNATASTGYGGGGSQRIEDRLSLPPWMTADGNRHGHTVIPLSDTIKISYVFASEEYPEKVCDPFNDAFGIWISGPKPGGGMYQDTNIARVPGTNQIADINTINGGSPGSQAFPNGCGGPANPGLNNSQYFIDNQALGSPHLVFDGLTVRLEATIPVIPCHQYQYCIELVDVDTTYTDPQNFLYDSALFLEADGIRSTGSVFTLDTLLKTPVSCAGARDGSLSVKHSNGKAPVTYQWSNGDSTATIDSLDPGTYSITITDANGCTQSDTATLTAPPFMSVSTQSQPASCFGTADGQATIITNGGQPPYAFAWSNLPATDSTATGLPAGEYQVSVTDARGCRKTDTAIITQPDSIPLQAEVIDQPSCYGASDGIARASVAGDTAGFAFAWDSVTDPVLSNLKAGTYSVTVTDSNGCRRVDSVTLVQPRPLSLTTQTEEILCRGDSTGNITANATGGNGPPYSYSWSTTDTGTDLKNLPAGTYTVTATDSNNCRVVDTAIVQEPPALSVTAGEDKEISKGEQAQLQAEVTGGTTPFSFTWQPQKNVDNPNEATTTASPSSTTAYKLLVKDANGCTAIDTVVIEVRSSVKYVMPKAFSPNGDGRNDELFLLRRGDVTVTSFKIFNRWGNVVHEGASPWDGNYNGQQQPVGTYLYVMEIRLPGGEQKKLTGAVSLVR